MRFFQFSFRYNTEVVNYIYVRNVIIRIIFKHCTTTGCKVKTLIFAILIGKSPIQNKKCSHPAFDIDPRELVHGGKFVFKRCLLAAVVKVLNSLTIDKFFDSFSHLQDVFYEQKGGSRHPFVQFLC